MQSFFPTDLAELVSLVSAQQSTLFSQQSDLKQFEAETSFLEFNHFYSSAAPQDSQIDLVLSEVRRLEDVAKRNEEELGVLGGSSGGSAAARDGEDVIKNEISQLRLRLAGTDQELQKTNVTLR